MALIQTLIELFSQAQHSVTHLEMRDTYGSSEPDFQAWLAGTTVDELEKLGNMDGWVELISSNVSRGVTFRRARVISEPHSDYIAFEHAVTGYSNIAGGELVRWLPRPKARDIALPGCDFWQIDDGQVCWVFQTGDGDPAGFELSQEPAEVALCAAAFEAVWERGIDHSEYKPA
ncbi:DUF6879 family protein [Nonomuraea sp. NPDC050556]|uniref:DUF6879 family protein n=1 Tax=Nonomuraea sp. NPDC050556 TaxID=3364369 RepID=UPI0037944BA7